MVQGFNELKYPLQQQKLDGKISPADAEARVEAARSNLSIRWFNTRNNQKKSEEKLHVQYLM